MSAYNQLFLTEIQNSIYLKFPVIKMATNHDAYINGLYVNVPQSGTLATPFLIDTNTSYPLSITQVSAQSLQYQMQFISTPVQLLTDYDLQFSKADLRASLVDVHSNYLGQFVSETIINSWAVAGATAGGDPLATYTFTSGATTSYGPNGDLARAALTRADFINASRLMTKQGIPSQSRFAVIPSDMIADIRSDASLTYVFAFNDNFKDVVAQGAIGMLEGFMLFECGYTVIYSSALAKQPVGTATANGQRWATLFCHRGSVSKAQGPLKLNISSGTTGGLPQYGGSDLYSITTVAAGSPLRLDRKGIITCVQA